MPPSTRRDEAAFGLSCLLYMTSAVPFLKLRAFLESTPPNVSVKIHGLLAFRHPRMSTPARSFSFPEVSLFCQADGGFQKFSPSAQDIWEKETDWTFVHYTCKNCGRRSKTFSLVSRYQSGETVELMKLGEYPPFSAPISARITKILGTADLELYRKGTRAEAQGLGIGAASYFRRIVDNQWKRLIGEIRDAAATLGYTDLSVFDDAARETKFSKAVDMMKDAIPPKLLILDGENPLTLLYKPLSVQLHDLTDEECLQQAADIRLVLTALLENIADVTKNQAELKGAADRLKQGKPKPPSV